MPNLLRRPAFWLCIALFFWLVGTKFTLIADYGTDLPFADQWDGEARDIYVPWLENRLSPADFFTAHNEHRIVFTRALSLDLLALNDQWDARLQTVVNALFHAALVAAFVAFLARWLSSIPLILFAVGTAALLSLPIYAENTLAAFQSQFYFILLFSGWNIAGATLCRPGSLGWYLGHLAGAAGLFAMASGFTSSLVVMLITVMRLFVDRRKPSALEWAGLGWCALVVVAGFFLRASVPIHETLRAHSWENFFQSLLALASWPTRVTKTNFRLALSAGLFLAPVFIVTLRWWVGKMTDRLATLIVGISVWWSVQIVLLAYARGGEQNGLSPRYFDTLSVLLLAGLLSWLWIFSVSKQLNKFVLIVCAFLSVLWFATLRRELSVATKVFYVSHLQALGSLNANREATIQNYVSGKTVSLSTAQPWTELPHYLPERLEKVLSSPRLVEILPASVRKKIALVPDPSRTTGFDFANKIPTQTNTDTLWSISSKPNLPACTFVSLPLQSQYPYLRFELPLSSGLKNGELFIETSEGQKLPITNHAFESNGRRRIAWIKNPGKPFRVIAHCDQDRTVTFSNPAEWARLSLLAFRAIAVAPWLRAAASLFFFISIALTVFPLLGRRKPTLP
ncbi:MAG: hypothetical protein QM715_17610 [Nibricoccus sp.]